MKTAGQIRAATINLPATAPVYVQIGDELIEIEKTVSRADGLILVICVDEPNAET